MEVRMECTGPRFGKMHLEIRKAYFTRFSGGYQDTGLIKYERGILTP